ncbi:MlaD family protein, partial [Nocardia sp. NPDC050789]
MLKLAKRVGVSARVITASVTTAVMVVGGCASAPDPLGGAQHFTADFLSVAGVFEGNPITVLGLEVGKVDRVVTRSRYVEVHMTVDKGVDIPKNVQAALVSPSIVTDR